MLEKKDILSSCLIHCLLIKNLILLQSVYGVLSAIEGLDAFEDMMRNTDIKPWYNRMKKSVTNKEGRKEYQQLIEKMQ